MSVSVPSVTKVNKAGDVLRSIPFAPGSSTIIRPVADTDIARVFEALDMLEAWRAEHAKPLQAATMGLRSRVSTAKCSQVEVSQRLKRIPTILDKLQREPAQTLVIAPIIPF